MTSIDIPDALWTEMTQTKFLTNGRMDHKIKSGEDLQGILMYLIISPTDPYTRQIIIEEIRKAQFPYMIRVFDRKFVIGPIDYKRERV